MKPIHFERSSTAAGSVHEPAQGSRDQDPHEGHDECAEQKLGKPVATPVPDLCELATRQQPPEFLGERDESWERCLSVLLIRP